MVAMHPQIISSSFLGQRSAVFESASLDSNPILFEEFKDDAIGVAFPLR